MAKEWFTIRELRTANLPHLSEDYLRTLVLLFDQLPPTQARTTVAGGSFFTRQYHAEFHISLLPMRAREPLQRLYGAGPIEARIKKLGLHRRVDKQPSTYENGDADTDAEIAALEAALQVRRERFAS